MSKSQFNVRQKIEFKSHFEVFFLWSPFRSFLSISANSQILDNLVLPANSELRPQEFGIKAIESSVMAGCYERILQSTEMGHLLTFILMDALVLVFALTIPSGARWNF